MGDIVIDDDYLTTTMTDLRGLSTELGDLCGRLKGLDGLVVGAAPVFDELYEFAEQWSNAADELAEEATGAADYVQGVLVVFEDADFRLAEQLVNRAQEGRG
ncbi:hypothetical protein FHE66_12000 [Georgenia sp. 311]|uniref:WXG100 family type VII secretion target n=1 Tax=Georgenia wutianyii TaxID=2585135 RepID=A0ABX5VL58_9MICO|nr:MULTISPECIES: hypothetical protein [Georgenia]QDB78915.1 hypothetical protein FE251_05650 [Georgenia wutianyii]TNC17093.1 hypothetical protein FHE66_12000 [Georgenia sp. 311]